PSYAWRGRGAPACAWPAAPRAGAWRAAAVATWIAAAGPLSRAPRGAPPRSSTGRGGFLQGGVEILGPDGLEQAATDAEAGQARVVLLAQPPARDEQQRDAGVEGAQALGELPAVHLGHADVGDDHVESPVGVVLERTAGRDGRRHRVADPAHHLGQRRQDLGVV